MTRPAREPTWRTTIAAVISSATFALVPPEPPEFPLWRLCILSVAVGVVVWAACRMCWREE